MADSLLSKTDCAIDGSPESESEFVRGYSDPYYLVKVVYHPEPGLGLLVLTLSDGRRLLVPCEDLSELRGATPEQIADFTIEPLGTHIWWHQIDDGIYFPEFLEFRWGNKGLVDRRDGGDRYRIEGLE